MPPSKATGPDELGFETQISRKDKKKSRANDSDSEDEEQEKVPLYLGISLHSDTKLMVKLRELLTSNIKLLMDNDHPSQVIIDTIKSIEQIWINGKQDCDGWKKPADYHVTTYYLGGDEEKTNHELYTSFEENLDVPVEILALVLVPNKIVTGICFPQHPVSNRCPHVTLMVNGWAPAMSNSLLEECCTRGTRSPFQDAYEELKLNGRVKEGQEILNSTVKVERNGPTSSCYFIALEKPIVFEGITKTYLK